MARPGLADEQVDRIKQVLLALDKANAADKAILDKLYGVQGYAEASLTNFQEIARVAASYGFVKKPELFSAGKVKL
jgi:ABC-type phosphate/phosphonate transport system substrate-binding protein